METMRTSPRKIGFKAIVPLLLVLAFLPVAAYAGPVDGHSWSDDIDSMISSAPYVEGEVIVGYYGDPDGSELAVQSCDADEGEELIQVESSNCEQVAGVEAPETAALAAQAADGTTISVVTSDSLTTAEMLHQLADDPRVAFAEPNYRISTVDAQGKRRVLTLTPAEEEEDDDTLAPNPELADLTPLQWANSNETTLRTAELGGGAAASSINVPGFGGTGHNMDRTVTVAVFDALVDYTHPDLEGVVREFSDAEQAELGCGQWGYNATLTEGQGEGSFLIGDHATHCAGIIGASWNGSGVSGVASDVSIVSVQVLEPDFGDSLTLSSLLRGFAFVDRYNDACDSPDDKIRVISMSIALPTSSLSVDSAARELGEKHGTVTVVSAGNSSSNKDATLAFESSFGQNPYALAVASSNIAGDLSTFSDYGAYTVALAAPGTGILSTVPNDDEYIRYIADADSDNIFYEGFENATPGEAGLSDSMVSIVQTPYDNPAEDGSPSAAVTNGTGPCFAGSAGLSMPIDADLCSDPTSLLNPEKDTKRAYFKVSITLTPQQVSVMNTVLESGEDVHVGLALSSSGNFVGCRGFYTVNEDGTGISKYPLRGEDNLTSTGAWAFSSAKLTQDVIDSMESLDDGSGNYSLELVIFVLTGVDASSISFDSIGIGTLEVAYDTWDGTSMAAPCVAGGMAVLAAAYPEEDAAQLVARVKESVSVREGLSGLVSTGGLFDLSAALKADSVEPGETQTVQATWPLYEIDLPLDTSTGTPFIGDDLGDYETYGQLVECSGKLWYFPAMKSTGDWETYDEEGFICSEARSFDIASGAWDEGRIELPHPLFNVSACSYDGELYVMGTEALVDDDGNLFIDEDGASCVLSFDPSSATWHDCSAVGIHNPGAMSLYAVDEGLRVFFSGGSDPFGSYGNPNRKRSYASFWAYDPEEGRGTEPIGELVDPDKVTDPDNPEGGKFTISRYNLAAHGSEVFIHRTNDNALYGFDGTETAKFNLTVPDALSTKGFLKPTQSSDGFQSISTSVTLVAGDEALYLVGYTDDDNSADTWIIPYDAAGSSNTSAAQGYGKHIASTRAFSTASAFVDGKIYALATAWGEEGSRVFRATQVEEEEPSPDPETESTSTSEEESSSGSEEESSSGSEEESSSGSTSSSESESESSSTSRSTSSSGSNSTSSSNQTPAPSSSSRVPSSSSQALSSKVSSSATSTAAGSATSPRTGDPTALFAALAGIITAFIAFTFAYSRRRG